MPQLYFVSSNDHKIREVQELLRPLNYDVIPFKKKIEELQTEDSQRLVRHKALSAFHMLGRPVFVEHTGLYLPYISNLPGGLTQLFWDALKAERFAALFGSTEDPRVQARTVIGYVDSRRVHYFHGTIDGTIAKSPRGPRDFQWDCVFVPNGHGDTFAEMGTDAKNKISMRRKAIDAFAAFLGAVT